MVVEDTAAALVGDDSKAQKVNIEGRLFVVHYDQVLTWLCRSDLSVT